MERPGLGAEAGTLADPEPPPHRPVLGVWPKQGCSDRRALTCEGPAGDARGERGCAVLAAAPAHTVAARALRPNQYPWRARKELGQSQCAGLGGVWLSVPAHALESSVPPSVRSKGRSARAARDSGGLSSVGVRAGVGLGFYGPRPCLDSGAALACPALSGRRARPVLERRSQGRRVWGRQTLGSFYS